MGGGAMVSSYQDLLVWQKSMALCEAVYRMCDAFPAYEVYCMAAQARRAVVSVPVNIAEGWGRDSTKEFLRHLSIAKGSLVEVETLTLLAQRVGHVDAAHSQRILAATSEISRMLSGLRTALRAKLASKR